MSLLQPRSREEEELVKVQSLTSEFPNSERKSIQVDSIHSPIPDLYPDTDQVHHLSAIYSDRHLCRRLVSEVRQATTELSSVQTEDRHTKVTPEAVARMWNIGTDTAKKVLDVTTQHGIRTALHPLQRCYRADHLYLNRLRFRTTFTLTHCSLRSRV